MLEEIGATEILFGIGIGVLLFFWTNRRKLGR